MKACVGCSLTILNFRLDPHTPARVSEYFFFYLSLQSVELWMHDWSKSYKKASKIPFKISEVGFELFKYPVNLRRSDQFFQFCNWQLACLINLFCMRLWGKQANLIVLTLYELLFFYLYQKNIITSSH